MQTCTCVCISMFMFILFVLPFSVVLGFRARNKRNRIIVIENNIDDLICQHYELFSHVENNV